MSDHYHVYTDGSFLNNQAIWGFIIYDLFGNVVHKKKGIITNDNWNSGQQIAGECWGVVEALKWAKENDIKIIIFFDYIGLKSWVADLWNLKPWNANKEYTVLYRKLVLDHKDYLIDMVKVKGHSGVAGNEEVDKFISDF